MPASRRRLAAKRVATPSASGSEARSLTRVRRPDFAAPPVERSGLALRMGTTPRAWHAKATQWQQITKRLPRQLNRIARTAADDGPRNGAASTTPPPSGRFLVLG